MKTINFLEAVQILLVVLFIVFVITGIAVTTREVSQDSQKVFLGNCLSFDDGYKFCHIGWVKSMSYITVYKNGDMTDLLTILSLQTVESHGYSITATGFSAYIKQID